MGDTSADRQRRYRAHKRGDHSLCDPARCEDLAKTGVSSAVTAVTRNGVTPGTPGHLGSRGRRLWRELHALGEPGPAEVVLIEEACRIADRLDRLDAVLCGTSDRWLEFRVDEDSGVVTVVVDRALSEARQQQAVLKQICAELRQSAARAGEAGGQQGGDLGDELTARRKKRLADAAGGKLPAV